MFSKIFSGFFFQCILISLCLQLQGVWAKTSTDVAQASIILLSGSDGFYSSRQGLGRYIPSTIYRNLGLEVPVFCWGLRLNNDWAITSSECGKLLAVFPGSESQFFYPYIENGYALVSLKEDYTREDNLEYPELISEEECVSSYIHEFVIKIHEPDYRSKIFKGTTFSTWGLDYSDAGAIQLCYSKDLKLQIRGFRASSCGRNSKYCITGFSEKTVQNIRSRISTDPDSNASEPNPYKVLLESTLDATATVTELFTLALMTGYSVIVLGGGH